MPKVTNSTFSPGDGVAAVDRALAIVIALETAAKPMTLAELAAATGLYKSTLLRLLASLERNRLVVRAHDQRYKLGPLAFRLGRAYEATHHVKEAVMPALEWLIEQGTESASFFILHDSQTRLCLFRIDSNHATLDRVRVGDLLPLVGAPGKVLLTFQDGSPGPVRQSALLIASYGERDPQCGAVSAPVFGPDGQLVGALSLSGPLDRFTRAAVKTMSGPLLQAAEMTTRALGGTWPGVEQKSKEPARAR